MPSATTYCPTDWLRSLRTTRTGAAKRALYCAARPLLSALARRHLDPATLAALAPNLVLFRRGMPLSARRSFAAAALRWRDATVLVQGCGTGWDVVSWAARHPARIIATDQFEFGDSWEAIARHCRDHHRVPVTFCAAPLEDHGFLPAASIDLCASDAVFEHCVDLAAVLRESHRLLRTGGRLYAAYGPLWFAPGGDHYSGRGGLAQVYNHVLLDPDAYRSYFARHLQPVEDAQSGGRYVPLDLFSKLTTTDYLAAFAAAGFRREALIVELCPDALAFEARYPDRLATLLARHRPRICRDDLRIKANLVRLSKDR